MNELTNGGFIRRHVQCALDSVLFVIWLPCVTRSTNGGKHFTRCRRRY